MSPIRLPALVSLMLVSVAVLPARAQEVTTLDGEPALRFVAYHGHLTSICAGVFTVTPTRVRYEAKHPAEDVGHSGEWRKDQITEFKPVQALGHYYVKMKARGNAYRFGVGLNAYIGFIRGPGRIEFVVRALHDFSAAYAEIEKFEKERPTRPLPAELTRWDGAPALRFSVTDRGKHDPTVHGEWFWLEVSASRVRLVPKTGASSAEAFELPKSAVEVVYTVRGFRDLLLGAQGKLYTLFAGTRVGEENQWHDAGYVLEALGPSFGELLARLQPKPKLTLLVVSVPAGADVYLNEERRGSTSADGTLRLEALEPGDYRVRVQQLGYQEWVQSIRLEPGDEQRLEATLLSLEPPKPTLLVVSSPGSAEVYLNDERQGTTSPEGILRFSSLAPGGYQVRLHVPGYEDWTQEVRLEPGEERRLEATLVPVPPPPPKVKLLTVKDVVGLLEAGVTLARLESIVKERGVSFELNDETEKKLRAAGATDALLLAIAKAKK